MENGKNPDLKQKDQPGEVIAMTQDHDRLRAVRLKKSGQRLEMIWNISTDVGQLDWRSFVDEIETFDDTMEQIPIVVGFDPCGAAFYSFQMPFMNQQELESAARFQIESKLPIPIEQAQIALRTFNTAPGQVTVTAVAASTQRLKDFLQKVRFIRPVAIRLENEGLVKVCRDFYSIKNEKTIVLSAAAKKTHICLVEKAVLTNAAVIDIGVDSLADSQTSYQAFYQDVNAAIEHFGLSRTDQINIDVISDGSDIIKKIVDRLTANGLRAKALTPTSISDALLPEDTLYQYRVAVGLAAMFLDEQQALNLFEKIYDPRPKDKKQNWIYSLKAAAAVAVFMIIFTAMVFYWTDSVFLARLQKHLGGDDPQAGCSVLIERQEMIKKIAQQRPDILAIFSEISNGQNDGISLDSFEYKKGQAVRIIGVANTAEQLYNYQKSLLNKKNITTPRIVSTKNDPKAAKINFTITFDYKNFTKKTRVLGL